MFNLLETKQKKNNNWNDLVSSLSIQRIVNSESAHLFMFILAFIRSIKYKASNQVDKVQIQVQSLAETYHLPQYNWQKCLFFLHFNKINKFHTDAKAICDASLIY